MFDLDGTLAESKQALDDEMKVLLANLLVKIPVGVISGGNWLQFEQQLVARLPQDHDLLNKLYLLPTCGTKFYRYDQSKHIWVKIYSEDFTVAEKQKIVEALNKALIVSGMRPKNQWGELIEDRGSQITFSALGQEAPVEEKKKWDTDFNKRKKIVEIVDTFIPEFSVRMGGATSIDVTKPGIDKAYGIKRLKEFLGIGVADILFVGDALFPGGNDYPAKEIGCDCIHIRDHNETKRVIETILSLL